MSSTKIQKRVPDPYVTAKLDGVLLVQEREVQAASLRPAIDKLLARMGEKKVSIIITSLDP